MKEFALRHRFAYDFSLKAETSAANHSTYLPLNFADQAKTESIAQAVQVNRQNDSYEGIVSTPACFMNSRVNNVKITEYTRVIAASDIPDIMISKALVTFGMSDHQIIDPAGNTILSALGFEKAADTLNPSYNATKLAQAGFCHADQDGLTTTQVLEGVTLRPQTLMDTRDGSLGPKIRKMMIGPTYNRLTKDFPWFNSDWYKLPSSGKRMLAFTGCFLYLGMETPKDETPSAQESNFADHFASETTVDENLTSSHFLIEYNEYNDSFDQSA